MKIIWILFGGMFAMYVLWVYYLAVMNLKRAEYRLSDTQRAFAMLIYYPGLLLDALVNIFVLTFVMLELPREWLVTPRVSRLKNDTGWRGIIARWLCDTLLDDFDPSGCHCK